MQRTVLQQDLGFTLVGPISNASNRFNDRFFEADLISGRGTDCLQWRNEQLPRSVLQFYLVSRVRFEIPKTEQITSDH